MWPFVKLAYSIRSKLSLLFLLTLVVPLALIVISVPTYYEKLIAKQTATLTEGTLTALTNNIMTYVDDLERMTITPYLNNDVMVALKLKASHQYAMASDYAKMEAEKSLNLMLPKFLRNARKDILATTLLPYDGSVYVTSAFGMNEPVPDYPFQQQDWYQEAVRKDGAVAFISVHSQDYLNTTDVKQVFSVARLIKDPDSSKPLAVMMADADTIVLESIIKDVPFSDKAIVVILDNNRKLLYANYFVSQAMLEQLSKGQHQIKGDDDEYKVVSKTINSSNWSIAVLFPDSVVKAQLSWIYWGGLILALGGLLITLLLFFTVSHWIVTPFKKMVVVMKRVQRGDLQSRFTVSGKDEIAQLGMSLNTMIAQLKELIDREYHAALGRRDAEYRALQSQIQPHFLYNTLNGFIGLNRMGERQLLEKAILSLSSMLRYILERNDWVKLDEELEFIRKYCELQQMRFQERLHYRIEMDKGLASVQIPKLLLQPIVENAVIHGMECLDRPCSLIVAAQRRFMDEQEQQAVLEITICDDGAGFEPIQGQESVGLTNVKERLRLSFEQAVFRLDSKVGQGTQVVFQIPLKGGSAG
ncbi:sensor histidine kinase [Paenibacillus sp. RC67]|uniref:cache domain-containing sensor histidine kinase n=1 Tax=Paenibacillus sp. RC67 TaxID=3039392 RepID=UPI0024AD777B|nr:sensor histidine kinase [Paenibacillus sp. RC67]